jgi:hypothetical protein
METRRLLAAVVAALIAGNSIPAPAAQTAAATTGPAEPLQIDWKTLLPEKERLTVQPPIPPAVHDYLSEGDIVALQMGSYEANRELEGKRIKVPGFVVPLERSANGQISGFLLVPYFGACIHLPPPPPNQVVYVRMRAGTSLKSFEDAIWVTGTLRTALRKSDMGAAVYTLDGEKLEPYRYSKP